LLLVFGDDEKVSLKALALPLTERLGAPQDVTTGNLTAPATPTGSARA
jgi:hypothetical protein